MNSLPPTTSEQRAHLYKDLEELITVGFLTHSVTVGDMHFCFRTLMPGDTYLIRHRARPGYPWHLWVLAHSLWLLNGMNLLGESHHVLRVYQALNHLPKSIQEMLLSIVIGLFQRETKAQEYLEAFCYEESSRHLWRTHGRQVPTGQMGIPGLERLGRTTVQGTWVAFNQTEDERFRLDSLWEAAKLVTSAQSPKGVQKIDQRDKQTRGEERERRQRVMDRLYYKSLGIDVGRPSAEAQDDMLSYNAMTADELALEMQNWVEGKEDSHDRVVREYKQRILDKMEEQRLMHEERMEALRQEEEARVQDDVGPVPLVAYTQEQLNQILRERGQGMPGARRIYDDNDPRHRLHDKYLARDPEAPQQMVATPDGSIVPADLASQIAKRQVPFQTKQEG